MSKYKKKLVNLQPQLDAGHKVAQKINPAPGRVRLLADAEEPFVLVCHSALYNIADRHQGRGFHFRRHHACGDGAWHCGRPYKRLEM